MQRYEVSTNYIQLKDKDQNKGASMYIEGRPKAMVNIVGFINTTLLETINKKPNYIFKGHEGSHLFVYAIKSIVAGEELLINYNLNRIDTDVYIMGVACIPFYQTSN